MTSHFKLQHSVLAMALAAIYPLQASAVPSAGVAQFIAGDVNIRRADGGTAPLVKGKDIESGQAILTGASGRAQVRFTDGGLVSLQPNTEFKVANYVDKADPKEDRFLVDLLRGSMRAITGLIGKRNRENYKVTTTTATIGIRGSGFNVGYNPDGSLGVTTELDAIEVCNAGGCVGLTAGESVRVINNTDAPIRTNVRANVPTPPVETERVVVEKVNETGKNIYIVEKPVPTPTPPAPPVTGTFTTMQVLVNYNATTGGSTFDSASPPNSTTLDAGKLLSFSHASATYTPISTTSSMSTGSIAGGDFIGWGAWATGTRTPIPTSATSPADRLHYVVGIPTASMPTAGTAAYTLLGGTDPTRADGAVGTLNSATFSANFTTGYVSSSLVTSFGTVSEASMGIVGSAFTGGTTIKGNFFGPNASRAGLVYSGFDGGVGKYFSGSAVFQK